jgi:hypothetical protein
MDQIRIFSEMDKIRKDIERIREKEEPKRSKKPVPLPSEDHRKSCKYIW